MQKKLLVVAFAMLLVFALAMPAMANSPAVVLDGQTLKCDTPPVVKDGRTLVPMRAIFEALGANVVWDGATKTVTANKADTNIKLVIGGQAFINDAAVSADVSAQIYQGSTMVPLRFVSEALGAQVDWDAKTSTVTITSAKAVDTPAPAPAPDKEEPAKEEPKQEEPKAEEPKDKEEPKQDEQKQEQPKADAAGTPFEQYLESMKARFAPDKAKGVNTTYQFVINEGNPGSYYITIADGKCTTGKGNAPNPTLTITIGEQLWLDIASGKENGTLAFFGGKFKVDGDPTLIQKLQDYFVHE